MTIDKERLELVRSEVERIYLDVEYSMSRKNVLMDYRGALDEGTELLVYMTLLNDIDFPNFQDDFYASIVSNRDFDKIYHRALVIEANLKRHIS